MTIKEINLNNQLAELIGLMQILIAAGLIKDSQPKLNGKRLQKALKALNIPGVTS
jgi:hypothetical protein